MKTAATMHKESSEHPWLLRLKKLRSLFLSASSSEHHLPGEMTVIYCAMGQGFIRVAERSDPPSEAAEIRSENDNLSNLAAAMPEACFDGGMVNSK
ncbi:hypothetical protein [Tatumella sp. UBA2305]|uniref:hypothetical protein n=1 Tax=Tatumella sp. UBA2305 TaxID=1947647 RepID=UPI0026001DB7|nr:hypothetical protein [Tatumella sp. UBA2305]